MAEVLQVMVKWSLLGQGSRVHVRGIWGKPRNQRIVCTIPRLLSWAAGGCHHQDSKAGNILQDNHRFPSLFDYSSLR